jgi:hypothetical protein
MLNGVLGIPGIEPPPLKQKLYDGFLLPIDYLDKSQVHLLSPTVTKDLELCESEDSNPMYHHLCSPTHDFSKMMIQEYKTQYTSNTDFLVDSQKVVENMASIKREVPDTKRFREIWSEIKEDAGFLERHSYMEWLLFEDLNRSPAFLQIYSMINIVSPIFSLLLPLLFLVFPFILLQLKGIPITFQEYVETLKEIAKSHFIGKALSIQNFNIETVLYFLFTAALYFLQMYQNTMSCIRYYDTVKRMNANLCDLREYLKRSTESMDAFVKLNHTIPYYADFCQDVFSHKLVLDEIYMKIGPLTPFCCYDAAKWFQMGHMLHQYYDLYACIEYEESLRYSIGFEGYIDIVSGIYKNYTEGNIGKCAFKTASIQIDIASDAESANDDESINTEVSVEPTDTVFVGQYYPAHGSKGIRNKCNLSKNVLITGVNASGKTTMLKTAAINIIFSQQFGFGFYESCVLHPYQHIHSYINIPDTSGRDSLFQAESRRCKEILDKIESTPMERHFCIFDELYSGTNPKEAAKSAYSLLRFLSKNANVRFVLTTHYVSVCKKFKGHPAVANYMMQVDVREDSTFHYTYTFKRGISQLEGGVAILKDMNYPSEIIDDINGQE